MTAAALWTARAAAKATGGALTGAAWRASGVSIDSRTAAPGDLFVALTGPNHDGHDHVAAALAAGCAAAMVARVPGGVSPDSPLLLVEDPGESLVALARAARARTGARIAGVTGSVGKTGVKEALALALAGQGPIHATRGNLNNQIGVPLTLARMPRDSAFGIVEIGMSEAGEIAPLSILVRPDVGIITTIAPAHLEFFDSVAAIAEAKAEIFQGLAGGIAVLNRDNPFFAMLSVAASAAGAAEVIGFGAHPEARARLLDLVAGPECSRVVADICGTRISYRLALPGRHWVMNSLAVLATVHALGADLDAGATALAGLTAPSGRGQRRRLRLGDGWLDLIDDSYNASPAAMRAALETLSVAEPGAGGRRIAVLGDMLELGPHSERLHAALAGACAIADRVYTSGPNMAHLDAALPAKIRGAHAADSASLAPIVAAEVRAGDVVMVKGSLGSRMAVVVEALAALEEPPPRAVNGD